MPLWAPGSDKTRGQGFLKETDRTFDPFLLRQGEPGTSQYIGKNCPVTLLISVPGKGFSAEELLCQVVKPPRSYDISL